MSVPRGARADEATASTRTEGLSATDRAEALYEEGKRLAASGDVAKACPLFEESQRIEPAIGTQFNLADCYERLGRRASALALFREVARVAQMSGKQERLRAAEERARALETKVARLAIQVDDPLPEQHVRLDGREVGAEERARGIPVDPGEHHVDSDAPVHVAWQTAVTIAPDEAARANVRIPPLPPAPTSSGRSPLVPLGIVVGGIGVLGLGLGALAGLAAAGEKREAGCNGVDCSQQGDPEKLRQAQQSGDVSTIAFIAGGALVAGGATLILLAPKRTAGSTPRASASIGPRGIDLRGTF
ncbi:MAG: tetratricopeptide repeat protein [Polyangiaceae bacterium]